MPAPGQQGLDQQARRRAQFQQARSRLPPVRPRCPRCGAKLLASSRGWFCMDAQQRAGREFNRETSTSSSCAASEGSPSPGGIAISLSRVLRTCASACPSSNARCLLKARWPSGESPVGGMRMVARASAARCARGGMQSLPDFGMFEEVPVRPHQGNRHVRMQLAVAFDAGQEGKGVVRPQIAGEPDDLLATVTLPRGTRRAGPAPATGAGSSRIDARHRWRRGPGCRPAPASAPARRVRRRRAQRLQRLVAQPWSGASRRAR